MLTQPATVLDLLTACFRAGITLTLSADGTTFTAGPKVRLTADLRAQLAAHKPALVAHLALCRVGIDCWDGVVADALAAGVQACVDGWSAAAGEPIPLDEHWAALSAAWAAQDLPALRAAIEVLRLACDGWWAHRWPAVRPAPVASDRRLFA